LPGFTPISEKMSEEVILVVDDSRQNADFIAKRILPSLGYAALTAYSGKAGLKLLQEKHRQISVMLLDLQMPDLGGLDLLRIAKKEGINVPAIMITAHSSEQVITDAFRLGVHDYLKKPVDVDQLNEAITRALSETRLRREKAKLTTQLQEQVSWLMALSDVGRSVTSTLNIDTVLRRILDASVSLTRAQQGFIALLDPKSEQLYLRAVKDIDDIRVDTVRIPVNDTLIKKALETGHPVRMTRMPGGDSLRVSTGLLVYSLIHVPIFYQKHSLGVLSVNNHTQRRDFTEGDEILLKSLADYAAIAIVNAHSFEKAQQEIEERRRAETALRNANSEIAQLIASLSSILIVLSPDLHIVHWNPSAQNVFGFTVEAAVGKHISELGIQWNYDPISQNIEQCRKDGLPKYLDPVRFMRLDGSDGYLGINISPIYESDVHLSGFILLGGDITERKTLENQLSQSQKLESIGQLAAGIAHEINTPIQFVSDNTTFIQKGMDDLDEVLAAFDPLLESARSGMVRPELIQEVDSVIQRVDLEYLRDEIPSAIEQSLDGIQRVAEIVRAMREFSHPGVVEKVAMDVNKAIENTLTVARNEWKYVADIQTNLAPDLPDLLCLPGEINQALLNIIVNAAQAIKEVIQDHPGKKGKITIETLRDDDWIEIHIKDTGPGIPENVRARIYEPFYTTKEVGKGSGQGLAIAYNVVEIKHGGKLNFRTEVGKGTTFIVRLPVDPSELSSKVEHRTPVQVNSR
jgi:PAS domain S-box-containing protein